MMPDGVLSTTPRPSRFFGGRAGATSKTIDYEDGGKDIQDTSEGLLYQKWRARLFNSGEPDSYVALSAREVPEFVLLTVPSMTEISFSFDASMRPTVAYVASDVAYINWYNTLTSSYVTSEIGAGVMTPRVSMDDKRYVGSNGYQLSDIILAYIKDGNLYTRVQRERYETEHLMATDVNPLIKIGMSRALRLQFMHEVV